MNANDPIRHPLPSLTLAFISPVNLFDGGNGAAQSIRTMLEQLAQRGVVCHVLTACCFDVPPGDSLPEKLRAKGLVSDAFIQGCDVPIWRGRVQGVDYHVLQNPTQLRDRLTAVEEMIFRDAVRGWLDSHRPDVVLTFGGLLLDIELRRCAKAAGAAVAFYLANPHYGRAETFDNVDLILANSAATAQHYANTMDLRCINIGLFVDTGLVVAAERDPQFITFINPLPEKGVALFLKLIQKAAKEAPDMRFLVVESRGVLATAIRKLEFSADILARTTVVPQQDNMMHIYAKTRILLMPSFWFEAAGRVLMEANANGIPVLASHRGGIPETLGGAGKILPIPEKCTQDYWAMPSDVETQPWWDELLTMWRANAHYEKHVRRAREVALTQTLEFKVANLEQILRDMVRRNY